MGIFRGWVTNKVDAKGRVSVPAKFRAVLEAEGLNEIFCYRSLERDVLEAGGQQLQDEVERLLDQLPAFSQEREDLEHVLVGDSTPLGIDQDGRITLPKDLREFAGITGQVTFVGLGHRFQLWEPAAHEAHREAARSSARDSLRMLSSVSRGGGAGGAE